MYISKNLNDAGRVKSYTIHDVSWNDLRRLLATSDALKAACPTRWQAYFFGSDALKEASIELKLSKQGE